MLRHSAFYCKLFNLHHHEFIQIPSFRRIDGRENYLLNVKHHNNLCLVAELKYGGRRSAVTQVTDFKRDGCRFDSH